MSIHKRGNGYEVRWRFGGKNHSKSGFRYKRDAEEYEAKQRARIKSHTFTPPKAARIKVAELSEQWFTVKVISPRTGADYREIWHKLIEPRWGQVPLEEVRPDGISVWVADLRRCYSSQRVKKAFTGVRFGEATALQVRDVDLIRSRLSVRRAFSSVNGKILEGPPKSGKTREIPLPQFLEEVLSQIFESPHKPESLLFPASKGGPIHYRRWRTRFNAAVNAAGLRGLRPHDLRHTYASLAIQSGVGPKVLQDAMGHSDIRLTMDTYAGLFEEDRDDLGARLDQIAKRTFTQRSSQIVRIDSKIKAKSWSRLGDLNPGPTHYECVALPLS